MPPFPSSKRKTLEIHRITRLQNGITSLMVAANKGDVSHLLSLLSGGADVNKEDNFGHTALTYAVLGGHADIVQTLLIWGANVNIRNQVGVDLLTFAAERNQHEIITLLKEVGEGKSEAKQEAKDGNGRSVGEQFEQRGDTEGMEMHAELERSFIEWERSV